MQTRRATRVQSDNGVPAKYNRIQRGCVLNLFIYLSFNSNSRFNTKELYNQTEKKKNEKRNTIYS